MQAPNLSAGENDESNGNTNVSKSNNGAPPHAQNQQQQMAVQQQIILGILDQQYRSGAEVMFLNHLGRMPRYCGGGSPGDPENSTLRILNTANLTRTRCILQFCLPNASGVRRHTYKKQQDNILSSEKLIQSPSSNRDQEIDVQWLKYWRNELLNERSPTDIKDYYYALWGQCYGALVNGDVVDSNNISSKHNYTNLLESTRKRIEAETKSENRITWPALQKIEIPLIISSFRSTPSNIYSGLNRTTNMNFTMRSATVPFSPGMLSSNTSVHPSASAAITVSAISVPKADDLRKLWHAAVQMGVDPKVYLDRAKLSGNWRDYINNDKNNLDQDNTALLNGIQNYPLKLRGRGERIRPAIYAISDIERNAHECAVWTRQKGRVDTVQNDITESRDSIDPLRYTDAETEEKRMRYCCTAEVPLDGTIAVEDFYYIIKELCVPDWNIIYNPEVSPYMVIERLLTKRFYELYWDDTSEEGKQDNGNHNLSSESVGADTYSGKVSDEGNDSLMTRVVSANQANNGGYESLNNNTELNSTIEVPSNETSTVGDDDSFKFLTGLSTFNQNDAMNGIDPSNNICSKRYYWDENWMSSRYNPKKATITRGGGIGLELAEDGTVRFNNTKYNKNMLDQDDIYTNSGLSESFKIMHPRLKSRLKEKGNADKESENQRNLSPLVHSLRIMLEEERVVREHCKYYAEYIEHVTSSKLIVS